MPSLLVVTPLIDEAAALVDTCRRNGHETRDVRVGQMKCTAVPGADMLVAVGGCGKAQFAVQAQYLIDRCPDATLLACVGAAGGLAEGVTAGDIVVATVTVEHDFKERFDPAPLPRHEGDPAALRDLTQVVVACTFPFKVQFGPVASGDEDIVDHSRGREVHLATDAVCVAWEGSGGARAAQFNGIGYLEIRGVTDAADVHAATSFRDTLERAMSNAAHLLLAWRATLRLAG